MMTNAELMKLFEEKLNEIDVIKEGKLIIHYNNYHPTMNAFQIILTDKANTMCEGVKK